MAVTEPESNPLLDWLIDAIKAVEDTSAECRALLDSLDAEVGRLTDELRKLQGARR